MFCASKKMILVANWKMKLGVGESEKLAKDVVRGLTSSHGHGRAVILCPSFTALDRVADVLRNTNIALGAQDVFWQFSGAYTGEVSARDLKELGCRFVIIGHSERRALGETDAVVNLKLRAAISVGLTPILCVGEPKSVRRARRQTAYVQKQLISAGKGLRRPRLIVAYEPIWAIGSGKADDPRETGVMASAIRKVAGRVPVLYGGSVTSANAHDFLHAPGIQGALVGGASLDSIEFLKIIYMK